MVYNNAAIGVLLTPLVSKQLFLTCKLATFFRAILSMSIYDKQEVYRVVKEIQSSN